MSHLICGFICYCYFYIKNINNRRKSFFFSIIGFLIVLSIFFIGIYNLRHQASWAVSIALTLMLVYFARKQLSVFHLFIFFIILLSIGGYFYTQIFEVLFAKDINVYQGTARETAALNGRVYLWKKYFAFWENFNPLGQWIGAGFALHEKSKTMMGGGMHNDYIRLFFSTGIIGIICYLFFLFYLVIKGFRVRKAEFKFLLLASIVVILMYSISASPLLASGALMYFVVAMISQVNKRVL